ncbi:DUF998 domain-containing protein [Amycolatopsis sacchari]|uniref:DUF998 domain-containing protein n=1 Tax=Amycolatopsis sacchari TaxID=115433 RepID=UPI000B88793D|nr:DUF998 domain-containing protein [Amycolatopsis sacchari]
MTTRAHAEFAVIAAVGAVLVVGYLDFALVRLVDPITDPVSDYVFHNGLLFVLAVALLMAGGIATLAGASRAGAGPPRSAVVLFRLWLAGLALVAVFPANPTVDVSTTSGSIHRLGGAVFLTCLPFASWLLSRNLAADPLWTITAERLRWCALVTFVTGGLFGLAQFLPWLPLGLLERIALAAQVVLVVVLALEIRRVAR